MARLLTPAPYYGTFHGICVYPMYGEDFVRKASSLTAERVKTDPAFKPTMAYAAMLAKASWLGASVYAMLPNYRKRHSLYRKLTGAAMRLLKEGRGEGEVAVELMIFIRLPKKKRAVKPMPEVKAQKATQPHRSLIHRPGMQRPVIIIHPFQYQLSAYHSCGGLQHARHRYRGRQRSFAPG